jgi:small subunit ribosomal protein S8
MTDLLSIAISRISVASVSKNNTVEVPFSKLILQCLIQFYNLGYINGLKVINNRAIIITLKYFNNKPVIRRIRRLSTPGNRFYYSYRKLLSLNSNKTQGFFLISTSKGLLTDQECFFYNLGGEPLISVS